MGARGGTTVAITTESGHDSDHSLSVTGRTANWNGTQMSATDLFQEGDVYSISGWVKLPAGTAISTGVKFTVQGTPTAGGGDTFTQVNNPVTTDATTWVEIAGSYTRPAGLSSVVLYVEAADNTASFLLDDVEITGPSAEPEVITVSSVDFEDGTIGNWTQSGGAAGLLDGRRRPGQRQGAQRQQPRRGLRGRAEPDRHSGARQDLLVVDEGAPRRRHRRQRRRPLRREARIHLDRRNEHERRRLDHRHRDVDHANRRHHKRSAGLHRNRRPRPGRALYVPGGRHSHHDQTDTGGPGIPPDFVPGGAINPTPTPVNLAQGTGNVAALTFDDGPNPNTTPELLDFLKSHDIKAVFCVIGQVINQPGGADLLKRIVAEGHTLCNHSTNFDDMGSLTAAQAQQRMMENLAIIRTALGNPNAKVPYFRAPNGSWGATQNVAVALGMQPLAVVNTISDWETQDIPTLTANLRAAMKPGEIVLCHDGGGDRSGTLAAVEDGCRRTARRRVDLHPPDRRAAARRRGRHRHRLRERSGRLGAARRRPRSADRDISDVAHGGDAAALISNRVNQGAGLGHPVTGLLHEGVTYELTAWLRFADGAPIDQIWLSMQTNNGTGDSFATLAQFANITNTGYTKVTATFTMQPHETAFLYFETRYQNGDTGNTSDFLVDDIVVRVPEPPVVEDLPGLHTTHRPSRWASRSTTARRSAPPPPC